MGVTEEGIHRQLAVHGIRKKELVDLILRNEHFAPAHKIRLRREAAFRQIKPVQHKPDPVRVIVAYAKPHDAAILLVCAQKSVVFLG